MGTGFALLRRTLPRIARISLCTASHQAAPVKAGSGTRTVADMQAARQKSMCLPPKASVTAARYRSRAMNDHWIGTTCPLDPCPSRHPDCAVRALGRKSKVAGRNGLVVSSHPGGLASWRRCVARRVATQWMPCWRRPVAQTVIEPHMSTIFGMLSMLHFDTLSGNKTRYLNSSMNAPLAGLPGFQRRGLWLAAAGVAVPGFWAGLEAAREDLWKRHPTALAGTCHRGSRAGVSRCILLVRNDVRKWPERSACSRKGREIYMPQGALLRP